MLSRRISRVIERETLEEFNIGCESNAHVRPFDQVMAEKRLLGKASVQNLMEGLNVIYRFSVKNCLAQQILLRIGDSRAIRIGSLRVREYPGKARRRGAGKCNADSWLDNGESTNSNTERRIDTDTIQWMSDGFHQAQRCARRQLGIGIQRYCISDLIRQPSLMYEVSDTPSKEGVEILELSTFSLATDPTLLC